MTTRIASAVFFTSFRLLPLTIPKASAFSPCLKIVQSSLPLHHQDLSRPFQRTSTAAFSVSSDDSSEMTLQNVRDLWYPPPPNEDSAATVDITDYINDVPYIMSRFEDWFDGGEEIDAKCRGFKDQIRKMASTHSTGVDALPDLVTKIVLFDQMTRNAFRFQDEAFAYEDVVQEILEEIFKVDNSEEAVITDKAITDFLGQEDLTFPDCFFVAVACEHQEIKLFHGVDIKIFNQMERRWPGHKSLLAYSKSSSEEHYEVLKRFGRYPHRNERKGRTPTQEELEWLRDYDNLPGWVKSQLPKDEA